MTLGPCHPWSEHGWAKKVPRSYSSSSVRSFGADAEAALPFVVRHLLSCFAYWQLTLTFVAFHAGPMATLLRPLPRRWYASMSLRWAMPRGKWA